VVGCEAAPGNRAASAFFWGPRLRANVYVDGFNLYYGCLRGTSYKWLNLEALAQKLLVGHEIGRIRYCTARVKDRPGESGQAERQQLYLRAIQTLPTVSIHYGHFLSNPETMPLARPDPGGPKFVKVIRTSEKGTDVNIASWLLHDAFRDDFDVAAVISNDSDLETPVRMVRDDCKKAIFVMMPRDRHSNQLTAAATYCKPIRRWTLEESQLPLELKDGAGRTIRCPNRWRPDSVERTS
jgi:uncharacterized LabA/DUF88 family protein